jgi:hypothetical protein
MEKNACRLLLNKVSRGIALWRVSVRDCIDHPIKPEADNRRLVDCVHCTFISVSFLTCFEADSNVKCVQHLTAIRIKGLRDVRFIIHLIRGIFETYDLTK